MTTTVAGKTLGAGDRLGLQPVCGRCHVVQSHIRSGGQSQARENMNLKLAVRSGAIVAALLMLPNVAWMLFYSLDAGVKSAAPLALSIAENVARFVALALPFFYSLNLKRTWSMAMSIGMVSALAVYYLAWERLFMGGGSGALHVWVLSLTGL